MLTLIAPKFKDEVGLYHDDAIAVCKATPREIKKTKQEVGNVFKSNGLKITIKANKMIVTFLDVTFDLTSASYRPYMKLNNKLLHVHRPSNHPPTLLKNIPLNIKKWLMNISSSEKSNEAKKTSLHTNKRLKKVATTTSLNSIHEQGKQQERAKPGKKDHLVQPSMEQQCQDQPGKKIPAHRR